MSYPDFVGRLEGLEMLPEGMRKDTASLAQSMSDDARDALMQKMQTADAQIAKLEEERAAKFETASQEIQSLFDTDMAAITDEIKADDQRAADEASHNLAA